LVRRRGTDRTDAGTEGHQLSVNPYAAKVSLARAFHLPEDLGVPGAEKKERCDDQVTWVIHSSNNYWRDAGSKLAMAPPARARCSSFRLECRSSSVVGIVVRSIANGGFTSHFLSAVAKPVFASLCVVVLWRTARGLV
jgi:hypothetical protein